MQNDSKSKGGGTPQRIHFRSNIEKMSSQKVCKIRAEKVSKIEAPRLPKWGQNWDPNQWKFILSWKSLKCSKLFVLIFHANLIFSDDMIKFRKSWFFKRISFSPMIWKNMENRDFSCEFHFPRWYDKILKIMIFYTNLIFPDDLNKFRKSWFFMRISFSPMIW